MQRKRKDGLRRLSVFGVFSKEKGGMPAELHHRRRGALCDKAGKLSALRKLYDSMSCGSSGEKVTVDG